MSVLLIFIDGLGIGTRGDHNPLSEIDSDLFGIFKDEQPRLPYDGRLSITDARLGVDGLPQSATGQTTILSGINAARLIGKHLHAAAGLWFTAEPIGGKDEELAGRNLRDQTDI